MKDQVKRKYRRRTKVTKENLKHVVRLAVHGSLNIHGGSINVGKDGVVNVHGNMTVTDMNAVMSGNVCLCGDKDQTISTPPPEWTSMPRLTPEMMHEVVRSAVKLYKKFSKKGGGKKSKRCQEQESDHGRLSGR